MSNSSINYMMRTNRCFDVPFCDKLQGKKRCDRQSFRQLLPFGGDIWQTYPKASFSPNLHNVKSTPPLLKNVGFVSHGRISPIPPTSESPDRTLVQTDREMTVNHTVRSRRELVVSKLWRHTNYITRVSAVWGHGDFVVSSLWANCDVTQMTSFAWVLRELVDWV